MIDFGTAHHFGKDDDQKMTELYGTPYYLAPEILQGEYDEKCDLWSIGVILYIMLCGTPPLNGDDEQVLAKVKIGKWSFDKSIWKIISEPAKDLIEKLMEVNVNKRLTAQEALAHPWLN